MGILKGKGFTQLGLNTLLMIIFFVMTVIILNLIISRWYFRYDVSSTKSFTLSPQTENILTSLKKDINIMAFILATERNYKGVHSLLDGYRYFNNRIDYSIYDLDAVPGLAQRYGVKDYDTFVITDGQKTIRNKGINEKNLTNSIIRLTRQEKKRVYLVQGYGERKITDTLRGGISSAVKSLRDIGYEVEGLNLKGVEGVPDDASVVVIAGPRKEYTVEDINKIKGYLKSGRALVMLDYEGARLNDMLIDYGLTLSKGLIIDMDKHLAGSGPRVPLIDEYPLSDITSDLNLTTFFPTVMAVSKMSGLERWYEYTEVIRASEGGRIENTTKGSQIQWVKKEGPPVIGMMVRPKDTASSIMVIGDSDFISNEYIDIAGNGNLFRNIISYLAGESDIVSIEPIKTEFIPLYITDKEVKVITYIFGVSLPVMVILAGSVIWLRRRRL